MKSYPQFSQNSAPAAAGDPQCGHAVAAPVDAPVDVAVDALVGGAVGATGAWGIGAPQTSQ
nr:hypothetical protein [Cellulomonas gilvus]